MSKTMEQVRQDLPHLSGPVPGPRAQAIIARDASVVSPSYTRCYPLVVESGAGATVEDVDGNRFLDFNAGIAVVAAGHCHPRVVEAIQKQAARLIHMSGTDFYYEELVALAEKLAAIAPGDVPRRVSFGNSGAEAVECAIKLARWSTKRDKIIAFFGSFHGRTMGALSLTARKAVQRAGFGPMLPGVVHAPYPNCYHCPFGQREESCAVECVKHIEDVLLKTIAPAQETAAIVVEPVQGEGGYVVPPQKFFDELARVAQENGILLVCDEVQSGMGRTGKMWASEHFNLAPDILAVAKGIASGMPLGATVARADLMTWPPGAHASTFGGNPLACAAAVAVFDLIESEGLIDRVVQAGMYLGQKLGELVEAFPGHATEARGRGLLRGLAVTGAPASVVARCREHGLLLSVAGDKVVRFAPPYVVERSQLDEAVAILRAALADGVGK